MKRYCFFCKKMVKVDQRLSGKYCSVCKVLIVDEAPPKIPVDIDMDRNSQ